MSFKVLVFVLLVSLLCERRCLADASRKIEAATACDSSTVVTGKSAAIRCHFGTNVRVSRHNIDVQFYPGDSSEPVSLLRCNWLVKRPDEPTCTAYNKCGYNSSFGNTLDLQIRNVTKGNEGRYICQLVPSDGILAQACRLTVTDDSAPPANQLADSNPTVALNPETPEERGSQMNIPAIVLGVTTVGFCICNLVLVVTLCRLRWKRRQQKAIENGQADSKPSSDPSTHLMKTNEENT